MKSHIQILHELRPTWKKILKKIKSQKIWKKKKKSSTLRIGLNLKLGKPKKLKKVWGGRGLILDPPPPLSCGSLNCVTFGAH
jgi:hypothetical protein